MNTKQWLPVLVAVIPAFGPVQAYADSGWYYDEDRDSIVYSYTGETAIHTASAPEADSAEHSGPWYYDEAIDAVVFNGVGSRGDHTLTSPSARAPIFDYEQTRADM